jgi:tetratricopeptide (TPR) repeat protein
MRVISIIILLFFTMSGNAQTARIHALKKSVPSLTGRDKVDCLNNISLSYTFDYIHSDSAIRYAKLALAHSEASNYRKGAALAYLSLAEAQGKLLGDLNSMSHYSKLAISRLKSVDDPSTLSYAYRLLGLAYTLNGETDHADKNLKLALQLANQSNNQNSIGWAMQCIGFKHVKNGTYWKAFEYLTKSQLIGKETNDSLLTAMSLAFIARSFNHSGDPATALKYYNEFLLYYNKPFILLWPHMEDIGYAHFQLQNYDSALYYQEKHQQNLATLTSDKKVQTKFSALVRPAFVSNINLEKQQFDVVLQRHLPTLSEQRKGGDAIALMHSLLMVSKAYHGKGEYRKGLQMARQLAQYSEHAGNNHFKKEAYQVMTSLFEGLQESDSAYFYYRAFISVKEEMEAQKFELKTSLYAAKADAEARIQLLDKENRIQQQELGVKIEKLQKMTLLQTFLLGVFILLLLIGLVFYRNIILKQKNEKLQHDQKQARLQNKALELEMQALRAQMNPHFIFNCLSAIDNLVQTNQADNATKYLTRFAKLIRVVLESSKCNLVPLHKDLEVVQLYLEMEQFRCNNKFRYNIEVEDELLNGDFKVPPMIIQPFIENAIHHGLLNKKTNDRLLELSVKTKEEFIVFQVIDNGIGRLKARQIKEKNRPEHQSYGIGITRERVHLHNKSILPNDVEIIDLLSNGITMGTKAIIRINRDN